MITDQSVKFTKHCLLEFGEYVHTHEYGDKLIESWTLETMALHSTKNSQGGHYFLNLHTARVIARFTWTALTLPTRIHNLVQRLAWQSPIDL